MNHRFVILVTLIFFLGAAVGYGIGFSHATELFIEKGVAFLKGEGVTIDINEDWVLSKIHKWTGQ